MKSVIVLYKGDHDQKFEDDVADLFKLEFSLEKEESGPLWHERWYIKFGEKEG